MNNNGLEKKAIKAALNQKWEEAVKLNKQILESGKENAGVHNRLGKAYSELGEWNKAVESFGKALELDPVSSVAEKGLNNAKMNKKAGVNPSSPKETVLKDLNTTKIIDVSSKKLEADKEYSLVPGNGKKNFYFLVDPESDKKIKRVGESTLNLKSGAKPKSVRAKVLEIDDENASIKLYAQNPIFSAEKQQVDPYLKKKKKAVTEEKKEIAKMYDTED